MTIKFIYNFFLFFLTLTVANSFCVEPKKRFGCHNLSSRNKIVNSNTNELSRNLERCMRDTGTYNKENLDIAQKLQNDFESAEQNTWSDIFYREVPGTVTLLSAIGLLIAEGFWMETNVQKLSIMGITYLGGIIATLHVGEKEADYIYDQKIKRKESIAIRTILFTARLQKK